MQVDTHHPLEVVPPEGHPVTLLNEGATTLYWKTGQAGATVSSSDSSLAPGAKVTITQPTFFISSEPGGSLHGTQPTSVSMPPEVNFFQPSVTGGIAVNAKSYSGTTHLATFYMAGKTGSNAAAINVVSDNTLFSAFEVSGVENTHGTIKVSHTNRSGSATGDEGAAMVSLELHRGEETNTAVQGVHIAEAEGSEGSTGSWITCQSATGASKVKEFRVLKANTGTYVELRQVETAPAAPESGHGVLYFRETEVGKTKLCWKGHDGAEHILT